MPVSLNRAETAVLQSRVLKLAIGGSNIGPQFEPSILQQPKRRRDQDA